MWSPGSFCLQRSPLALNGQKLLPPRLRLSFPVFSSALTLPEVNITAASREWVGVRFQLDGEFAACVCVCGFSPTLLQRAISFKRNQLARCEPVSAGHLLMPAPLHPAYL